MARSDSRQLLVLFVAMAVVAFCSCGQNRAPDVPDAPAGPGFCFKDTTYTFTTTAGDPDGDSVAVRFDWGDTTPSYWMGWFASGDTVAMTHAWQDTGTYEVHAWAQDRKLVTSDSSAGLTVRVGLRRPPNTPSAPSGPESGGQGSSYAFTARAFHPDGIKVSVRFAWGDGGTSDWGPLLPSGSPVKKSHAWSAPGTYAVTVQARDTGNALSGWSAPREIVIEPGTSCLWRLQLAAGSGYYPASSPAIGPDGTIYVGSPDSALYAVNADGTLKWRHLTGASVSSSPAVASDGTIYVGSYDSSLYAVNPDGTLRWRHVTGGIVRSSPAIAADGTVYFGSDDYYFYALNADGALRWSYLTGGGVASSPAIGADGTVYFGAADDYLYALNADGTLKWRHGVGHNIGGASPAIGPDGAIYCGRARALCALNADGSLRWSFSAGGTVQSSPAIAVDGTIYFGTSGDARWGESSYFHALNSDGTSKWSLKLSGPVMSSSPAVSAFGTIYCGSWGNMNALSPDATLKWRYETGDGFASSPTIGSEGTVYFASNSYTSTGIESYLYALKGNGPLASSPWPKFHHDLQNTGRASRSEGWLRMVGWPMLFSDSSGFRIDIVNVRPTPVTVSSLVFFDTPDSAYMRSFFVDGNFGVGFPKMPEEAGTGPGDTVFFDPPVTISPDLTERVEVIFRDFYPTEYGLGQRANVHGKVFRFRFDDGSEILAQP